VRNEFQEKLSSLDTSFGMIQTDLGSVRSEFQEKLSSLDTSFGVLQTDLGSVREELQLRVPRDAFDELQEKFSLFDSSLAGLNRDVTTLRDGLDIRLQAVVTLNDFAQFQEATKRSLTQLGESSETVRNRLEQFQGRFQEIGTSLGTLQTTLQRVQDELIMRPSGAAFDALQATLQSLTTSFETLNRDVITFRDGVTLQLQNTLTLNDFRNFREETNRALATKLDSGALERFSNDITLQVTTLRENFSSINTNVDLLKNSFNRLDQNLGNIRVDLDNIRPRP
jgi:chromosome segregation ATPase